MCLQERWGKHCERDNARGPPSPPLRGRDGEGGRTLPRPSSFPSPRPSPARGEGDCAPSGDFRMNDQGRPTRAEPIAAERKTFTGNRGLAIEEALLFEIGRNEVTGVDVDVPSAKG